MVMFSFRGKQVKYKKPFATQDDVLRAIANELADINDNLIKIRQTMVRRCR